MFGFNNNHEKRILELERQVEWQDLWIRAALEVLDSKEMKDALRKQYNCNFKKKTGFNLYADD